MRASSGRMVIHVGAPKTGSTYLQKRLLHGRDLLRERGVFLPILPRVARMAGNAKLLATALLGEASSSFERVFPDIDVPALDPRDVLEELLDGWDRDRETLILSAENFRASHAARLRRLLDASIEPTIVLFVRRQDAWMESYFNQLTKTRDIHESFERFAERIDDADDERFCHPDWFAHHSAWRAAFGCCEVVFYDEVKGALFPAFCRAAGLPDLSGIDDPGRTQESLDACQLAYLQTLDVGLSNADFKRHRNACADVASSRQGWPNVTFLSPSDRERVLSRYARSNRRLAVALGREPDGVFASPSSPSTYVPLEDFLRTPAYEAFRDRCSSLLDPVGRAA